MTSHTERDFTGIPFVAGSIIGQRCWDLHTDGTLNSPQYKFLWTPDINDCECEVEKGNVISWTEVEEFCKDQIPSGARVVNMNIWGSVISVNGSPPPNTVQINVAWRIGSNRTYDNPDRESAATGGIIVTLDQIIEARLARNGGIHHYDGCSCGFYAYLNGNNEYKDGGSYNAFGAFAYDRQLRVVGIIEGFGETLIGKRGFRSKRAKVLAVAIPAKYGDLRAATRKRYPDIAIFHNEEQMLAEFPATDVSEVAA